MSRLSLIFSALIMLAFILMMTPGVLAMNRGKVLRNIAIWLAIMAGLGFIYTTFGPGSKSPLFSDPPAIKSMIERRQNNANGTMIDTAPAATPPATDKPAAPAPQKSN